MKHAMKIPTLSLVLIAAIVSMECTVIDPPKKSGCRVAALASFDPMRIPQDTMARVPFLDPQALFADEVYVVRPIIHAERTVEHAVKNAEYVGGEKALVSYLKENVLQHIYPGIGWLKPPTVRFMVDAQGAPGQVALVATSGNDALDKALVRIFSDMPHWEPATDALGQAVPQAFLFFTGKGGC
jgi:hypothetical protein